MACEFEVLLDAKLYPAGPDAAVEAWTWWKRSKPQLTIYRDTSEVSRLNMRASGEPVVVEERLFELLVQAKELWKETGEALDITSGASHEGLGLLPPTRTYAQRNGSRRDTRQNRQPASGA